MMFMKEKVIADNFGAPMLHTATVMFTAGTIAACLLVGKKLTENQRGTKGFSPGLWALLKLIPANPSPKMCANNFISGPNV